MRQGVNLFFGPRRYDLGRVGRYKLNRRLGQEINDGLMTLSLEDVVAVIRRDDLPITKRRCGGLPANLFPQCKLTVTQQGGENCRNAGHHDEEAEILQ